jgi:hypothetical protein
MFELKINIPYQSPLMEELLVHFDIYLDNKKYVAKVKSEMGGLREFSARNIEKLMEQVIVDISEEFENL